MQLEVAYRWGRTVFQVIAVIKMLKIKVQSTVDLLYIYIYRERERERERDLDGAVQKEKSSLQQSILTNNQPSHLLD